MHNTSLWWMAVEEALGRSHMGFEVLPLQCFLEGSILAVWVHWNPVAKRRTRLGDTVDTRR